MMSSFNYSILNPIHCEFNRLKPKENQSDIIFDLAFSIVLMIDFVESAVSKEKSWFEFIKSSILFSINLPASIETFSGWNGERPRAISLAFTNSLQIRRSGSMLNEAAVYSAPLHPLIVYSILSRMLKARKLYSHSKQKVVANLIITAEALINDIKASPFQNVSISSDEEVRGSVTPR